MTEPHLPPCPLPTGPFPRDFGRYRLEGRLGTGAHGTVYRATDTALRTPVALKIPSEGVRADDRLRERFHREARLAARLSPIAHVCHTLDVGSVHNVPYYTMQLVDGKPLDVSHRWDQRRAALLTWKLACALTHVHAQFVVHRDIKPDNILLDANGEPTITDFGIALSLDPEEARLTTAGEIVGTLHYMAPEQFGQPDEVGPACDVYGLGVVLYHLITGRMPFATSNVVYLLNLVANEPPPVPSDPNLHLEPPLLQITLQALSKNPADRFGGQMRNFANALAGFLGLDPLPAPATAAAPNRLFSLDDFRFVFCGLGEVAPSMLRPGFLYLDVGNGLRTGVIDHHHLNNDGTCTACLVRQYVNLIDAALPATPQPGERFTIILHEHPDLDAVASAFLVTHYLTTGSFPPATQPLVDYVARIDEGSLGLTLAQPFALYAAYKQLGTRHLLQPANSKTEMFQALVRDGLTLLRYVVEESARHGIPVEQIDAFACPGLFTQEERQEIDRDVARYQRKLADPRCHARQLSLSFPDERGERQGVPVLLVRDVQNSFDPDHCRFFKDWARSDAERSGRRPGFVALCVFHSEGPGQMRRGILSVTPDSGVSLRGLGAQLDEAEKRKREAVYGVDDRAVDPVTGAAKPSRPGYVNSDPWYDGRGHHYTIIDSPRAGTLLTADEIETLFLRFGRHQGDL